ncbi:hypothetical protein MKW98_012825 [Papaver atlanticum]|uniref:RBR-type E3 ubiquitin transferase n=1 Tax=Papaver atlanticum TaxID=357466 RepID=A0AAD4XI62_9MAGN|nr:hypothetical protein MKW98_012825 [Papaver atlanticum]
MAESLLLVVDDFYFAVLSVGSDDGVEEDVFPISDEKYAEKLCLQEALMSSVSLGVTKSSSNPRYRKSEIGESSSSSLKIEDNYKNTENNSRNSNDKKMKSSMDVNASAGDVQYSTENSFCEICMETKPTSEMRKSTIKCSHVYCSDCITKHIAAKIQDNITQITCPEFNCKQTLEPNLCRDIIPAQVFDRWENALCESLILASQKIYCPFKDCSVMLVNDDDGVIIRESECPHCRRLFCAQCKVPWHSDLDCNEYQDMKRGGLEDMLLIKLAEKKKWRRCPRCKYYVEKKDGCLHITCRCKYEFCYSCGVLWNQSHSGCQRI